MVNYLPLYCDDKAMKTTLEIRFIFILYLFNMLSFNGVKGKTIWANSKNFFAFCSLNRTF